MAGAADSVISMLCEMTSDGLIEWIVVDGGTPDESQYITDSVDCYSIVLARDDGGLAIGLALKVTDRYGVVIIDRYGTSGYDALLKSLMASVRRRVDDIDGRVAALMDALRELKVEKR